MMWWPWTRVVYLLLVAVLSVSAVNLKYLDPKKLQTKTSSEIQQNAAQTFIRKYTRNVKVYVNAEEFRENKDAFNLTSQEGELLISASSGVAAVWGFHYYLKKYCNSHIGWKIQRIDIPGYAPEVSETVVANDRFRYYQDANAAAYSYVWWDVDEWREHVQWMALNGINLALAPVAQEAAWARVYRALGMTQDEIDEHFTGPAYLPWLRYGNLHGWGGPLPESWHEKQRIIQKQTVQYMHELGIIPIFPAFNGHVPRAFSRIYPNVTFHTTTQWVGYDKDEYCCSLFIDPTEPLFATIAKMFSREVEMDAAPNHIYSADPFIQNGIAGSTEFNANVAKAIFSAMSIYDDDAVWVMQNWIFIEYGWRHSTVQKYLNAVPEGRILVLDMQSEQRPGYFRNHMYYGQPFIWNMHHNWGGNLGMFGAIDSINNNVYLARDQNGTTMVGMGITPSEIGQNDVVYELMLEAAWRAGPVRDLDAWAAAYARRRYGCDAAAPAWRYLIRSVYNFKAFDKRLDGQSAIVKRPTFNSPNKPWSWYKRQDLFNAFKKFVFIDDQACNSVGFFYDLVEVTRQVLQYRAEQLYNEMLKARMSQSWVFKSASGNFMEVLNDIENVLHSNSLFSIKEWIGLSRLMASNIEEKFLYRQNALELITTWLTYSSPYSDYAAKNWVELYHYYYIPRWQEYVSSYLDAMEKKENFDEEQTHAIIKTTVEKNFLYISLNLSEPRKTKEVAMDIFKKWYFVPYLKDLPIY